MSISGGERTARYLAQLQKEVIEQIKKIEFCDNFYPQKSALCDWCDFQNICPLWKHPKQVEQLPVNEYKNDLLRSLTISLKKFPIPKKIWRNFFRAMRTDAQSNRFFIFEDFLKYCEGATVSPTVILKVNVVKVVLADD